MATPLVSGTVRALWSRVDVRVRSTAYALDATATELVFVVGPSLVAVLAVLVSPALAMGLAAVLATAGALGVATAAPTRAYVPVVGARSGLFSTVLSPGMPRLLVSGSALMLGFGALEVAIPAFADDIGFAGPVRRAARAVGAGLHRRRPVVRRARASAPRCRASTGCCCSA